MRKQLEENLKLLKQLEEEKRILEENTKKLQRFNELCKEKLDKVSIIKY